MSSGGNGSSANSLLRSSAAALDASVASKVASASKRKNRSLITTFVRKSKSSRQIQSYIDHAKLRKELQPVNLSVRSVNLVAKNHQWDGRSPMTILAKTRELKLG